MKDNKGHSLRDTIRIWLLFFLVSALLLQWLLTFHLEVDHSGTIFESLLPGLGIFAAAYMLSWAAELAQKDIPQTLALTFLALIAVLPEYAVDVYFAWTAGKDPSYIPYATANMTGANRLLIGLGWPAVVLVYWFKTRRAGIELEPTHRIETSSLLYATIYSFVIPLKGTLSLIDFFFMIAIFVHYIYRASRTEMKEPELAGPPERIARFPQAVRRFITILFFLISGYVIYIAAEPFAEGLLHTGRRHGIEEFILVQWLAPLASESPEFIVAIIFAARALVGASFGTLLSSKVNQWTLLIGMLPLVYVISLGGIAPMELDARQREEIFLTSAQSLFAVAVLSNMIFSWREGIALLVLFSIQLVFPSSTVRWGFAILYVVLAFITFGFSKSKREGLFTLLAHPFQKG
jgi:cation:H+ antiporter